VDNTFETYRFSKLAHASRFKSYKKYLRVGRKPGLGAALGAYIRITEKRRLATAAAAIKQRMVIRRSPLVVLPVFPLKRGSVKESVMVAVDEEKLSACWNTVTGDLAGASRTAAARGGAGGL
jgi:hypothetical protein